MNHAGRMANPKIPNNRFISSVAKACEAGGATPEMMDTDAIEATVELFGNSARLAREAGFDLVELQFGHGYLIAQFLSPLVNDRDDEYGGSLENRLRFGLEVLGAVRSAGLPVIARISGDEMVPGGPR